MNNKLLRACRFEENDIPPIWLMRQAGRYLPEYREIRKGRSMLSLCRDPEMVAEITMQPLRRFDFDAAILFSDIVIPFLGFDFDFDLKEGVGPVVSDPIRSKEDIRKAKSFRVNEKLPFIAESIKILKEKLEVPLLGFSGAPFTLGAYLIEGKPSRDFRFIRSFMYREPDAWHTLAALLSDVVIDYLGAQIEAGVDAVQIFDSWVGVLDEKSYRLHILPHMQHIFSSLRTSNVPLIHFSTGTSHLLSAIKEAGHTVLGVDWRMPLDQAWEAVEYKTPIQGNLDPALLLSSRESISEGIDRIKEQVRGRAGYIFNLGHGILPETPIENVEHLIGCWR